MKTIKELKMVMHEGINKEIVFEEEDLKGTCEVCEGHCEEHEEVCIHCKEEGYQVDLMYDSYKDYLLDLELEALEAEHDAYILSKYGV